MRCVTINGEGYVVDVVPPPAEVSNCALVLATPEELTASPFRLTLEEGGLIGAAIALLWGTAFGLRALRRALES
jgi:hypothetical protein